MLNKYIFSLFIIFILSFNLFGFYEETDTTARTGLSASGRRTVEGDTGNNLGIEGVTVCDRYIYKEYVKKTISSADTITLSYTSDLNRIDIQIKGDSDLIIYESNLIQDTYSWEVTYGEVHPRRDQVTFYVAPKYTSVTIFIYAEAIKP